MAIAKLGAVVIIMINMFFLFRMNHCIMSSTGSKIFVVSATEFEDPVVIRAQLFHVDHPSSHLRVSLPNAGVHERLALAASRSHKRAAMLNAMIKAKMDGTENPHDKHHAHMNGFSEPLVGSSVLNEYFTVISMGTPPAEYQVLADTGSSLVWLACKERLYKRVEVPSFHPNNSSTYHPVPCTSHLCKYKDNGQYCFRDSCSFTYSYLDNSSLSGKLARETLSLKASDGRLHAFKNFAFGCATNLKHEYNFQGLVGLDRNSFSLPRQIKDAYAVPNRFSYCLIPFSLNQNFTSFLQFGCSAAHIKGKGWQRTPLLGTLPKVTDEFYLLNLKAITLGNVKVETLPATKKHSQSNLAVIDSGTTLTYINTALFMPLAEAFIEATSDLAQIVGLKNGFDLCVKIPSHMKSYSFPKLIFHFQNADMQLPVENYMLDVDDNIACLNLIGISVVTETNIIGNVAQQNFEIIYDNEDSQLAFARKDCAMSRSTG